MSYDNVIDIEEVLEYKKRDDAIEQLPEHEKQIYKIYLYACIESYQGKTPFQKLADLFGISINEVQEMILGIDDMIKELSRK
ncbi:hypothetical protein AWH56_016045 [Anaerobacillus isosaccharinicus]|uniref:RNA polymerase sigma-70 region 4 domain-containing protein n=1 Tax=Anaerobacillus isosaccharinicus TaxID=1532552 RepID=A0A1S2LN79_9BACI|nr:hypothetical protein [Anaerobacillus isosaccharinicus]MBA5587588.1 hypothetical protein [Anaerobacillus isosaccharinicus]QOY34236.1 hypothetical protein AWH56_016045 [Anaerobacillus isosaccharinicus]